MRTSKLLLLIMLIPFVVLFGCNLFTGPSDTNGTDGTDGTNGTNGEEIPLAELSAGTGWSALTGAGIAESSDFADAFMQSFDLENSGGSSRGLRPLLPVPESGAGAKATVPISDGLAFEDGSISDYPEPGLTTSYVVADASADVGANVYKVTATTTYPESNTLLDHYIEEYYVKDVDPVGSWTTADQIVDADGSQDRLYRLRQEMHFDDGSVRYEKIVKAVYPDSLEDGFAAFDVEGSLLYPDFSYPDTDSDAVFSSIVIYSHDRNTNHDFWFWEGTEEQGILGVRFYTEHYSDGGGYYKGTMVAYERAVSKFTTLESGLAKQLDSVFEGSEHNTLAQSVLRGEVVFAVESGQVTSTATGRNTIMRSHVVDATDKDDFLVQLLNNDAAALKDSESATLYVPSGAAAAEIEEDVQTEAESQDILTRIEASNPDGSDVPLVLEEVPGDSDFADVYSAIQSSFYTTITVDASDDVAGLEDGGVGGAVPEFAAQHGYEVPNSGTDSTYDLKTGGSVEAWVYVHKHMSWAGIVHKGKERNFSDEAYTLQFWGRRGNVTFGIVQQSPYKYKVATSRIRLNTGKWYYLVGNWDATKVRLYIFGEGITQGDNNYYLREVNNTLNPPEPADTDGPIVIGSQFMESAKKNGYYGFDGYINGVVISDLDNMKTAEQLEEFYNANKDKTANWMP